MVKKLFAAALFGMLFLGVMLPAGTAQRTVYQNDKYGFSIAPPIGWTIEESDDQSEIYFWGPSKKKYRIFMQILIIYEDVPDVPLIVAAEAFKQGLAEGAKQSNSDVQVLSEGGRMINEIEAYELTYTHTFTIEDEVFELQNKAVILPKDGVAYIVVFSTPQDNYDEYLPLFEESIGTLKFEEKGLLQKIFDRCLP